MVSAQPGERKEVMKRTGLLLMAALVALSMLVAACGTDSGDEGDASDDASNTQVDAASDTEEGNTEDAAETEEGGPVTVVATEFAYEGPDTLPAGKVTIEMDNQGKQPHELVIGELLDGKTIDDVNAVLSKGAPGKPPKWFKIAGGTGAKPGDVGKLDADLKAGNYVFICLVPDKDSKKPHAVLGMVKALTVE
jgi:predicted small secreted protein